MHINYRAELHPGGERASPASAPKGAAAGVAGQAPFVVVLGMHRSGTSLSSHVLKQIGVGMGDEAEAQPSNPKGQWERLEIVGFHNRIFELSNRGYYSPIHDLRLPLDWWLDARAIAIQDEMLEFLRKEMTHGVPFGFKDPRTARLLPMWHRIFEELGINPKIVLCIRNPAQVARSLKQRDDLPPDLGEYRWFIYMAEIFRHLHNFETCIIEYEAWFDEPGGNLGKLTRFLGLPESAGVEAEVSAIVDRQLRHDTPDYPVARQPLVRVFYDLVRRFKADPAAGAEIGGMLDQFAAFQQLHEPIASEFEQLSRMAVNLRRVSGADAVRPVVSWRDPEIEAEWGVAATTPAHEARTPEAALYLAEAIRQSPHEIEAEQKFFEFRGNDLFLHPPRNGRTRLYASNIVSASAGAVLSYAAALYERSAGPVRFRVRVADQSQSVISELVAMPGEVRDVDLLLDRFSGPLSIELTTEMSDEGGSNTYAWATFREPRIRWPDRHGQVLERYLRISESIPGWTRQEEALELARASLSLPPDSVVVEIGAFLGSGTVLLAGARKTRGSGKVHIVDPFDCSGDSVSVPIYNEILAKAGGGSLRSHFEDNVRTADLGDWVEVHQGRAAEVAAHWTTAVDLIFFDGDQSRAGVREAYESWAPFLKPGGIIAVHNSAPGNHRPDHDGSRCLVEEEIRSPRYAEIRLVCSTTFARKSDDFDYYMTIAGGIPGWREGEEAAAVYEASYSLDHNAIIVEVGAFFGRSTVLLAGARQVRGSGKVHCIDPFDRSGDAVSVPIYHRILNEKGGGPLRGHFDENIRRAGLTDWVEVHQASAYEVAATWDLGAVDLLLLDGDQSPKAARDAYNAWIPHLRQGGILMLGNSTPREYAETQDGNRRLSVEEVVYPQFIDIREVRGVTIARKADDLATRTTGCMDAYRGETSGCRSTAEGPRASHGIAEQWNTDYPRWLNICSYNPSWDWRAVAAARLTDGKRWICDLGCGGRQILRGLLADGAVYLPSDLCQWTDDTIVCDINQYALPLTYLDVCDFCYLLGVIEYTHDTNWLFEQLSAHAEGIVFSYNPVDFKPVAEERAAAGWVNSMSMNDIKNLMARTGYQVLSLEEFDNGTVLIKVVNPSFTSAQQNRRASLREAFLLSSAP